MIINTVLVSHLDSQSDLYTHTHTQSFPLTSNVLICFSSHTSLSLHHTYLHARWALSFTLTIYFLLFPPSASFSPSIPHHTHTHTHFASTLERMDLDSSLCPSGGPGSGKALQCERMEERFGLRRVALGDLLCSELQSHNERGRHLLDILERGEKLPEVSVVSAPPSR